ncbi:MAG: hypothetical protein K8R99_01500 [Actinomycetia bacterium]|nr:hypothetical protein [Actinomycetes bacterium]
MATRGSYGIAEWYGRDITLMSVEERKAVAIEAVSHHSREKSKRICPFALKETLCSKKGGVCSIRPYTAEKGEVEAQLPIVTVCPMRFLENADLLRWVAKTMLGTSDDVVAVKETPFLKRAGASVGDEESAKAGRIDWLLVDTASTPRRMAALETQSLYFSGGNMRHDFDMYLTSDVLFKPPKARRPDYRSGGPKRLSPQLAVKVPLLRAWGIKMAVMVDDFFFNEMATMPEITGTNDADKLLTAEIVWFVAKYEGAHLVPSRVAYSRLDDSVIALNAAVPMSATDFAAKLDMDIAAPGNQGKKVFNLS